MNWYHRLYEGRETFEDPEEERGYREKQRALTDPEADALWRLLQLPFGSRVLDVFCGNGRHAIALAGRGLRAVGTDIAMSRIGFARRWAVDEGRDVPFAVGDAESLPFRAGFSAILILGGSFAHSVHWERNAALLRRLRAALFPGGILLIDNPNPLRFWQVHHSTQSFPPEGDLPFFDLPLGKRQSAGVVRYYGAAAMERLLQEAGFRVEAILGDREGARYVPGSNRLIAIGMAPPPVPDGTHR